MSFHIEKDILHYYADLLRLEENEQREPQQSEVCVRALHNTIRTMKQARHGRLCGENFSRLDFGNIPLNNIHFSLEGQYPSSFDGAKLNEWNFRNGHSGVVTAVAWSPDGKYILSGSSDCTAILWDASSGLMVRKFSGNAGGITSVSFSGEKSCITESLDYIRAVWDISTGECMDRSLGGYRKMYSVPFAPNLRYYMTEETGTVRVYDTETGELVKRFPGHKWEVRKAFFDKRYCLSCAADDRVKLFDFESEKCLGDYDMGRARVSCAAFSPDGKLLYTGLEGSSGRLWDISSKKCIAKLSGHSGNVHTAAFSPDSRFLCTGSDDCGLKIWDTRTGKCLVTLAGYDPEISGIDLIRGTERIITYTGPGAGIWDIFPCRCVRYLYEPGEKILAVSTHKDGKYYVTDSKEGVKLRDLDTGECKALFREPCDFAALSGDDKYLIIGRHMGVIKLWETEGGRFLGEHYDKFNHYSSAAFMPDSRYCLVRSIIGDIRLDLKTGEFKKLIEDNGFDDYTADISPNGRYALVVPSSPWAKESKVCVRDLKNNECIKTYDTPPSFISKSSKLTDRYIYGIISKEDSIIIVRLNYRTGKGNTARFYNIDGLHIKGCSFKNIIADELTKEIICQYGGNIERSDK